MTNTPATNALQGSPTSPGRLERRSRSGKGALALAVLLALCSGALLWWLADEHPRALRPGPTASPEPISPEPEPEPLVQATRLDVSPLSAAPGTAPPEPCRLVVVLLAPKATGEGEEPAPEFTGTAHVRVREAEGAFNRVAELTAADPRVELRCPAGEYEFTLERYGPEPLGALPIRSVLEPGADEIVTLLLARLHALTGTLTDESQKGYEGVRVALEWRGRTAAEARTGRGGSFALAPLPVAQYELVVGDPEAPLLPRRGVNLAAWLGEMRVVVPVLLELEVRVVDEQGRAVAGARIEGLGQSGGRVTGASGQNGRLRALHLPPGRYRFSAWHESLGRGERSVELTPGSREPLEIRLRSDESEDESEDDAEDAAER